MPIQIQDLIEVSIAVAPNAVGNDGFGALLFATPAYKPVSGESIVRSYTNMADVQQDFPDGEIYKAAMSYYSQTPKPKRFMVGSIDKTDGQSSPATLTGRAAVLDELKKIKSGSLTLKVDGKDILISNINLSAATDFDYVKNAIDTALPSTVRLSQKNAVFTLSSTSRGSSTITFCAKSPLAEELGFTAEKGNIVQGSYGATLSGALSKMLAENTKFYYVVIDRKYHDKQEMIDAALWCEANKKVFGYCSTNEGMITKGAASQARTLHDKTLKRTLLNFSAEGTEYPEISILGRAATVNFNGSKTALTLAYKQLPTITAANLNPGQFEALREINANAFIKVGSTAIYMDGKMADGTWFDTVQGVDWLEGEIGSNVFNVFYQTTTKIPFTDSGVAIVNQAVTSALEKGVTNGLIAPGYDSEGTFYDKGYKVTSVPIETLRQTKGARIWEGTSFIAIGAGALHGAVINGSFIQ
ncbi:MAG: DUF3383 family protein [Candidatus Symbiopectobacterium sp. Dall1.0]|nr:DUF3383 family protein [Candidatus Symbiopectobacterium sp. Dall1.0]